MCKTVLMGAVAAILPLVFSELPNLIKLAERLFGGKKDFLGANAGNIKLGFVGSVVKSFHDVLGTVGMSTPITIEQAKTAAQTEVDRLKADGVLVGHGTQVGEGHNVANTTALSVAEVMAEGLASLLKAARAQ